MRRRLTYAKAKGEHREGPADGWFGAITVMGFRESSPFDFDEVSARRSVEERPRTARNA